MIIAVASGKGGTGKTTLTAALARAWPRPVVVADLDVEAPNLHLLLAPEFDPAEPITLEVPRAEPARCTGCGACANLCQFRAIAVFGDFPAVFPELCHGCGGCLRVCPTGALVPDTRVLGEVRHGRAGAVEVVSGEVRIGEAMSTPLIRAVQARLRDRVDATGADGLIDSPPGTSCPATTAVRPADAVVLVAEPTPFGLHDLRRVRHAFAPLGRPLAVVVNRADLGDGRLRDYCRATGLPILAEIPFDRRVTASASLDRQVDILARHHGETLADVVEGIRALAADDGSRAEASHAS